MAKYTVYILHFDKPITIGKRTFQHYIGYTNNLEKRIAAHRSGRGAMFVDLLQRHGGEFEVALTEEYDERQDARKREVQIKKRGAARLCPICQQAKEKPAVIDFAEVQHASL